MANELFYHNSLDQSIFNSRGIQSLLLLCFIDIPAVNVNIVDPNQTPGYAASDLGLFAIVPLWDTRHKWENGEVNVSTRVSLSFKNERLGPILL